MKSKNSLEFLIAAGLVLLLAVVSFRADFLKSELRHQKSIYEILEKDRDFWKKEAYSALTNH